jgi:hypothetical protein
LRFLVSFVLRRAFSFQLPLVHSLFKELFSLPFKQLFAVPIALPELQLFIWLQLPRVFSLEPLFKV